MVFLIHFQEAQRNKNSTSEKNAASERHDLQSWDSVMKTMMVMIDNSQFSHFCAVSSIILFSTAPAISGFQAFWKPGSFSLGFFMRLMGDFSVTAFHGNSDDFK